MSDSASYDDDHPKAAIVSEPHHHEYPFGQGDTFFAYGGWLKIKGMVAMGMPIREITLHVEPIEHVE